MPLHLDHIVILIPHSSLLSLPAWIPKNFTVTPGGVHAEGKTENRLVCFQDGSYLEFISFVKDLPSNREGHCWGHCKFGIIDFAFTSSSSESNFSGVNSRLEKGGTGLRYEKPLEGGRTRPDGAELKWKVTWPVVGGELGIQRGEVPFFCHDVTDRSLRVPLSSLHTVHPTFAYGIKSISIYVPESRVALLSSAYEDILDSPNIANKNAGQVLGMFEVERMRKVDGAEDKVKFYVQAPSEEWQKEALEERHGVLIGDLVVGGLGGQEKSERLRIDIPGKEGVGRVWLDL